MSITEPIPDLIRRLTTERDTARAEVVALREALPKVLARAARDGANDAEDWPNLGPEGVARRIIETEPALKETK